MKYSDVVFLQCSEADEVLDILKEHGEEKAFEYLMQWYTGEEPIEETDGTLFGKYDNTYYKGNLIMNYNSAIGYIGLTEIY